MNELAASRALYRGFLFLLAIVALALVLRELTSVLIQLFAAAIIAAAVTPLVDALTISDRASRWRWRPPRALVVLLTYVIVGFFLLLVGSVVLAAVAREILALTRQLPEYAASLQILLVDVLARFPALQGVDLQAELAARLERIVSVLVGTLGQVLSFIGVILSFLGAALNAVFILFIALYLAVDGRRARDYFLVFVPALRQEQVSRVSKHIARKLGQWVAGQLVLCAIVGAGAWIGLQLIGVPYAAMLGLVWAIAEFVPGIGPFISTVPSVLLGFAVSPVTGVLSLVFCLTWSQLENNVITPRVMGEAVELHPLVILVALLVGSELLGLAGALLAIPVAAALGVVIDELRAERARDLLLVGEEDLSAPISERLPHPDSS